MSTANHSPVVNVPSPMITLNAIRLWVARKRIPISIVCFTTLVVINLTILDTSPSHPLAVWHWNVALGQLAILAGLAIRSWSAGTLHKHKQLTTVGPYALVRNPLYLGSFLMMYGFAFIMMDWLSLLFIAGPMTVLYYFQVKHEEKHLANAFPALWPAYTARTPRFVPYKLNTNWRCGWSMSQWLRNREYQAILGVSIGLIGLLVLKFMSW